MSKGHTATKQKPAAARAGRPAGRPGLGSEGRLAKSSAASRRLCKPSAGPKAACRP